MTRSYLAVLVLTLGCTACGLIESEQGGFQLPVPQSTSGVMPHVLDLGEPAAQAALIDAMADKRALFIGEIHDHAGHHQNQLQVIQDMYARYPDMAIGVEYFQQPFQRYLDDYIAGRIEEKEMLQRTEYYKRWKLDYRMLRPIFVFAREKHIPVLALNVTDEIHSKVFKGGLKSLIPQEREQIPQEIKPANTNYLQRLKSIFNSHPQGDSFPYFVEGVLLWDEGMAETAANYLNTHPQSKVVVLAGLVHILYGDGIPERLNHRLGANQSVVTVNGADFGQFANIADYVLSTPDIKTLPSPGKLGVTLMDEVGSMRISDFAPGSPAKVAGMELGDRIISLDGIKVASVAELKTVMFDKQPNQRVQVSVLREMTKGTRKELQFEFNLR